MIDPTPALKEIEFLETRISGLNWKNQQLQSTITDKDVEILRFRSLLKEMKEELSNWVEVAVDNCDYEVNCASYFDIIDKLKQEGI